MTDTPSMLDAWNGSVDDELTKLLRRAGARGRLTQHDVVRALPNVELTPEVVEESLRRCREAGIEFDDVFGDLDDLRGALPEGPGLPGADLVLGNRPAPTVVVLNAEHATTSASRARRLSATLRRRSRLSADRGLERGVGTSDP
ncbi:MAG: RNA polymerase sigma factor region1.1 domain-containing protein, partial [Acidimicrobiales bacterium]